MQTTAQRNQRGAVAVIAALWVGVALACLMVLDVGNFFWQQRELQKIADLAALAGAEGALSEGACAAYSQRNAMANGLQDTDTLVARSGRWQATAGGAAQDFFNPLAQGDDVNACGVQVTRTVSYLFLFKTTNQARTLSAQATALQVGKPLIRVGVRSALLVLNSTQSNVLNLLLGGLLGGQLQLDLLSWNGLLNTNLDLLSFLNALAVRLNVTAGNYDQLLNTKVGVGVLLDAALDVLQKDKNTASASISALQKIVNAGLHAPGMELKLADILGLQTGSDAGLKTNLNVFQLVLASIQAAGANNAATAKAELNLGVANVGVVLNVIQPPQWVIGASLSPPLVARTAQLDLKLRTSLLLDSVVLNLGVKAASGTATVESFRCSQGDKALVVNATTSLLNLDLQLALLGIELKIPLAVAGKAKRMNFLNPPRLDKPPASDVLVGGAIVTSLVQGIDGILQANLGVLGLVAGGLVEALLSPLTLLLDAMVDGLLKALGIDIAQLTVDAQLDCGYSAELVY